MHELLNTLYVQAQGAVLSLQHDTVRVRVEGQTRLRVPLLRLQGIAVFGNVTITPFLIHRCGDDGRDVAWFTRAGRFRARIQGRVRGNVMLRRAQHLALQDAGRTLHLARQSVAAKIQNTRHIVMRAAREAGSEATGAVLRSVADDLACILAGLPAAIDLNEVRGSEGMAARAYFGAFPHMIRADGEHLGMSQRNRRPPRDPMNSLLSFLYALLRGECESALEGVGLDPQVGYLHCLRSGRPALALDLMEEFRSLLADRVALTLVNRRQLTRDDFDVAEGGVRLTDMGRKTVLAAYEQRKGVCVEHRVLDRKVPLGLLPHTQARLMARHLRGDLPEYVPFVYR